MLYTILALIFLGTVIGWGVVRLFLALMVKKLTEGALRPLMRKEILNPSSLTNLLDSVDWEHEMSPLIDQQLDKLIDTFKQRNAMIGLFLTQEVAKPLQMTAKEELLNMIPKLKKTLIERLVQERAVIFLEEELSSRIKRSLQYDSLWRKLQWYAAALGASLGFLGAIFLLFFQRFI